LKKDSTLYGGMMALFGALLVSTKAIIVKLAYQYGIDSASLLMLRMLFALPFFMAIGWHALTKNRAQIRALKRPWLIAVFGFLGYYIASFFDLSGLQYIDASLERIILFVYPTIVLVLSYFWLKERITVVQLLAILATFAGLAIAFAGNLSLHNRPGSLKGALMVFLSAASFAVYLIGSQKILAKVSSRLYNSLAMIVAALAILLHNYLVNGFNLFDFSRPVYLYALLMAVLSTVLPSFLIVKGISIIGAKNSAIIGTIGPVSTIFLASVFLGERINAVQWAGTLVVMGGVLFLMLVKEKK